MSEFEAKISYEELSLKDELIEIFKDHTADVYVDPGLPFANIPDKCILFGMIKSSKGKNSQVVLEVHTFRNGDSLTLLSVADQEYIISDSGVIYLGEPKANADMDSVVKNLRFWVRETVWDSLFSELPSF